MKKEYLGKVDFTNKQFGSLTVIELDKQRTSKGKGRYWFCRCDCGKLKPKSLSSVQLRKGPGLNCGCGRIGNAYNRKYVGKLSGSHWAHTLAGAKSRGISVDLSQEEAWQLFVNQNGLCALSGRPLTLREVRHGNYIKGTASLDRIDSNYGYNIDNCQWLHKDVQKMKNNLGQQYFVDTCIEIVKYLNTDILSLTVTEN